MVVDIPNIQTEIVIAKEYQTPFKDFENNGIVISAKVTPDRPKNWRGYDIFKTWPEQILSKHRVHYTYKPLKPL